MSANQTMLFLQDDQLSSQFRLSFPNGIPGGGTGENVALRMDQSFDPPEETVGEYQYFYKGIPITKPNMLDETDRHFTMQVRIDQQWSVFDDLVNWKNMVHNPRTGTALPFASVNTTLIVEALDQMGAIAKKIKYTGVVIKGIKVETFEQGSSDPSRVTLNFIYQSVDYTN